MANPIPTGSDVRAGTYKCTNCGYELDVQSVDSLPPCSSCGNNSWEPVPAATQRKIRIPTGVSG